MITLHVPREAIREVWGGSGGPEGDYGGGDKGRLLEVMEEVVMIMVMVVVIVMMVVMVVVVVMPI